jgi:RNA recognition motif-containing protein
MKLYVGNLDKAVTVEELKEAFQAFGELGEVTIIKDRSNNVSKGFGFVEMPKKAEAEAAIAALQGKEFMGRNMDVNEARPKPQGGGGFRGGFGGGNRGGGGFGGGKKGGGFGGGNRSGGGGGRRY